MVDDLAYDRESGRIYFAGSDFVDATRSQAQQIVRAYSSVSGEDGNSSELDRYYVAVLANLMCRTY